ncbi:hypothetical protein SHJG_5465 [Streptomyces hygroscopicus subsp. jinggangensis 5008]|nr:hypothetical protein SHJG_5465 [Streptomyces hygroscopicus subsp. jinggangensis 5008]AGF64891.1 hypothetical protein SHJGH_5228 [Streptomyces hygroscopicus subsp. jinggangensis TL01]
MARDNRPGRTRGDCAEPMGRLRGPTCGHCPGPTRGRLRGVDSG